jgi:hypothetical protein
MGHPALVEKRNLEGFTHLTFAVAGSETAGPSPTLRFGSVAGRDRRDDKGEGAFMGNWLVAERTVR